MAVLAGLGRAGDRDRQPAGRAHRRAVQAGQVPVELGLAQRAVGAVEDLGQGRQFVELEAGQQQDLARDDAVGAVREEMGRGGAGLFAGQAGVTELAATPDIHAAICGAARLRRDRPARVRHRIEHAQPPNPALSPGIGTGRWREFDQLRGRA